MWWEGADGEVSLSATLMCPAELQSQERWGAWRVPMIVQCVCAARVSAGILSGDP